MTASSSCASSPLTTRWRWSTPSTRSGCRARRPRPSRSSTRSATRPTCTACRSATPGNIAAYWLGYTEYLADGKATKTPRMLGYQAAGAAPIVTGQPGARTRSPSPPRSGSAIRRPGSWPRKPGHESGGLIGLGDRRGDPRCLPAAGAAERPSSASRPRRPASPGCCRPARRDRSRPVPSWCARSPGTA